MAVIPGAIPVTGFIGPTDSTDVYAVTDAIYGIDGLRNVADHTERNAITAARRRQGMLVGTQNDNKYWSLKAGPWNFDSTDWELAIDLSAGPLAEIWETVGSDIQTSTSLFSPAVPNVLPAFDDQQDLGSQTKRWKDLYLGSDINFSIDLTFTAGGGSPDEIIAMMDSAGIKLYGNKSITSETPGTKFYVGDTFFQIDNDNGAFTKSYLIGGGTQLIMGFGAAAGQQQNFIATSSSTRHLSTLSSVTAAVGANASTNRVSMGISDSLAAYTTDQTSIEVVNTRALAMSSSVNDKFPSFISTKNSTIDAGVRNSVILGGDTINATASDTVYVPDLNIQIGKAIRSASDFGYLNLREGSDDTVLLSNDNGTYNGEGIYLSDNYVSTFIAGWTTAYEAGVMSPGKTYLIQYTNELSILLRDDDVVLGIPVGLYIGVTEGTNGMLHGAATVGNGFGAILGGRGQEIYSGTKDNIILGGEYSVIQAGVNRTAIIGGSYIEAWESDHVYVPAIGFFSPGPFTTTINHAAASADRTITFPNASGTVALTTDTVAKYVESFLPGTVGVPNSIVHGLGTTDVMVQLWHNNKLISARTVEVIDGNTIEITFLGSNPSEVSPALVKAVIIGL